MSEAIASGDDEVVGESYNKIKRILQVHGVVQPDPEDKVGANPANHRT